MSSSSPPRKRRDAAQPSFVDGGELEPAEADLTESIARGKDDWTVYQYRGWVRQQRGDEKGAAERYGRRGEAGGPATAGRRGRA
jgi:hypothetical protein